MAYLVSGFWLCFAAFNALATYAFGYAFTVLPQPTDFAPLAWQLGFGTVTAIALCGTLLSLWFAFERLLTEA